MTPFSATTILVFAIAPPLHAEATLVALAEELDCTSVFTTDRADFSVYRLKGRKPFRIVPSDCAPAQGAQTDAAWRTN